MFSQIPLPKVVPDVPAGGALLNAMSAINEYTKGNEEAKYAPLTVPAKALSELAYANFMQPQYVSKLMSNPQFVANLSPEQKEAAKNLAIGAGTGQTSGNSLLNVSKILDQINQPSLLEQMVRGVGKAFGIGGNSANSLQQNQQSQSQPTTQNAMLQQPIAANQNGNAMVPNNNQSASSSQPVTNNNVPVANPAEASQEANNTLAKSPHDQWAENVGNYEKIIAQAKAEGTKQGDQVADLGEQQKALNNSSYLTDSLIKQIQDPIFNQLRSQIPYYQDKQLWWWEKNGSPEIQKMVGNFKTTARAMVGDYVNQFNGKPLVKEFDMANQIKINDNDTVDVALGKLQALKTIQDITTAKNQMMIHLMEDKHMNLGEAVNQANKLIPIKDIEKRVNDLTNPRITQDDFNHMLKKYPQYNATQLKKKLMNKGYSLEFVELPKGNK